MGARGRRVWLYGTAAVVAAFLLWWMFYPDYLAGRCRDLGYRDALARYDPSGQAPALRPSEARWYGEHCWQGVPR